MIRANEAPQSDAHGQRGSLSVSVSVFLRPIVPGQVKTRLSATLGPATTARLYRAFVADTLAHVERAVGPDGRVVLWVAGDPQHPSLSGLWKGVVRRAQPELDLGARQRVALEEGLQHAAAAIAIGTDSPTLPANSLGRARDGLTRAPVVVVPAADGGYCLLAVRAPYPGGLLDGVRWSTRHTLADLAGNAARLGLAMAALGPHYDVDDARDLALLRTHLALDPSAAPQTAAALGLSQGGCAPASPSAIAGPTPEVGRCVFT